MPAQVPLYQEVEEQIKRLPAAQPLRLTAVRRLALLVTGIIAARSGVIGQVAAELFALGLTRATAAESIARRLRRTLADARLEPQTCYAPMLGLVVAWDELRRAGAPVVVAVDESSKADEVHLLRASLAYRGTSLPLAWEVWEQNQAQPEGHYWAAVEAVLARVAALLPPGLPVVVVADRAYDVPAFVDRVAAHGWHWAVRCKANGAMRFRDRTGRERAIREVVRRHLPAPGRRWKGRGQVFKDAGWRDASVVAVWGRGHKEPLVVLTDLPPRWKVLRAYQRRFWIAPGFRNDKRKGWQWEASQVQGVAHHAVLLVAMAWASLVTVCAGIAAAQDRLAREATKRARGCRGQPRHARQSVFTLGLRALRRWLYGTARRTLPWRVVDLDAPSWEGQWHRVQATWLIFGAASP